MNRILPLLLSTLLISACSPQSTITYTRLSSYDDSFTATVPGIVPPSIRRYDLFFTSAEQLPGNDARGPVWLSVLCSLTDSKDFSNLKYYAEGSIVPDSSAVESTFGYRARVKFSESVDDGAAQSPLDVQTLNTLLSRRDWIDCTIVVQRGTQPATYLATWRIPTQDILREVNR